MPRQAEGAWRRLREEKAEKVGRGVLTQASFVSIDVVTASSVTRLLGERRQ